MKYNGKYADVIDATAAYSEEQQVMLGTFVYTEGQIIPQALVADNLWRHLNCRYDGAQIWVKLLTLKAQVATKERQLTISPFACRLTNFDPRQDGVAGVLPRWVERFAILPTAATVLGWMSLRQRLILACFNNPDHRTTRGGIIGHLHRNGFRDETDAAIRTELEIMLKPKIDHTAPGRVLGWHGDVYTLPNFNFRHGGGASLGELLAGYPPGPVTVTSPQPARKLTTLLRL